MVCQHFSTAATASRRRHGVCLEPLLHLLTGISIHSIRPPVLMMPTPRSEIEPPEDQAACGRCMACACFHQFDAMKHWEVDQRTMVQRQPLSTSQARKDISHEKRTVLCMPGAAVQGVQEQLAKPVHIVSRFSQGGFQIPAAKVEGQLQLPTTWLTKAAKQQAAMLTARSFSPGNGLRVGVLYQMVFLVPGHVHLQGIHFN